MSKKGNGNAAETAGKINDRRYGCAMGIVPAAAVLLWIFRTAALLPFNETGKIHGLNYNLVVYFAAVVLSFLVFLAGSALERLIFSHVREGRVLKGLSFLSALLSVLTAAALLFYIYKVYADEVNNFPESFVKDTLRQRISHPLYFSAVCFAALLFFLIAKKTRRIHVTALRWLVILIGSFFSAYLLWCPSPYYDMGGTMLHVHAYTNTIANVSELVPFSRLNVSIYGHYALFYLPLVKLFGGGYPAVALSISIFGFLTFFLTGYAAHKSIKNDVLFFLTMIALVGTTTILNRRGQYYQINPHRLLMPALSLACVTWKEFHIQKKDAFRIRLLELLIGTAAITWNLETGIFAILTISLSRILGKFSGHRFFSKEVWLEILFMAADLFLSFALSWTCVGVYNVLAGGSFLHVRTFIYPLLSGNYDVNNLRLPLRGWTSLYVLEIILFAAGAFVSILNAGRSGSSQKGGNSLRQTVFAVSVSGLFNMVYFMNRTAYGNIQISHIELVLLAGIISDYALSSRFSLFRRKKNPETSLFHFLVSGVVFAGLFFLSAEAVVAAPGAVAGRKNSHSQELSAGETWYSQIRENVPKDTFAYGIGMPEAYMSLHWDTGCHMIDFADPNEYNTAYLEKRISEVDAVLTTDAGFAESHPEFTPKGSWTAYYCTATYYVRN